MNLEKTLQDEKIDMDFREKYIDQSREITRFSGISDILKKHIADYSGREEFMNSLESYLERSLNGMEIDFSKKYKPAKRDYEKNYLSKHLMLNLGNIAGAAEKLGMQRSTLRRKIKRYNIEPNKYRPTSKEYLKNPYKVLEVQKNLIEKSLFDGLKKHEMDYGKDEIYLRIKEKITDLSFRIAEEMKNGNYIIKYKDALKYFDLAYLSRYQKKYKTQKDISKAIGISESELSRVIGKYKSLYEIRKMGRY